VLGLSLGEQSMARSVERTLYGSRRYSLSPIPQAIRKCMSWAWPSNQVAHNDLEAADSEARHASARAIQPHQPSTNASR